MKTYFYHFLISLIIVVLGITTYHFIFKQKIGYVKTGVILQKYQGMTEANKQFESEVNVVKGNIDTLRNRFESLKSQEKSISPSKKAQWGYELGIAEKEYFQYNEASQQQMQQRQQQLTTEVLNKVNGYIQEYGKEHHYNMIFGTTNDGSILYGEEKDDLTDIILNDLNAKYKSQEAKK